MLITLCIAILGVAALYKIMDLIETLGCWLPILILLSLPVLAGLAVSTERGIWRALGSL